MLGATSSRPAFLRNKSGSASIPTLCKCLIVSFCTLISSLATHHHPFSQSLATTGRNITSTKPFHLATATSRNAGPKNRGASGMEEAAGGGDGNASAVLDVSCHNERYVASESCRFACRRGRNHRASEPITHRVSEPSLSYATFAVSTPTLTCKNVYAASPTPAADAERDC